MSSPTSLLIHQAQILLPDAQLLLGDVLLEDGKISQVAPEIPLSADSTIIDAAGLTLLPRKN